MPPLGGLSMIAFACDCNLSGSTTIWLARAIWIASTGQWPSAQGWSEATTLGMRIKIIINPNGVVAILRATIND
jgi:hypothetical protein